MNRRIEDVREFREKFNLGINSVHVDVNLHKKLIKEEFYELMESIEQEDDANTLKEFVDLFFVVGGYLLDKGIEKPLELMFDLVFKNNMSKLGSDGRPVYREDGKLEKPSNFKKLDPQAVVDEFNQPSFLF